MTKKELSQLYDLNREVKRQSLRLEELQAAAKGGPARITGLPHT